MNSKGNPGNLIPAKKGEKRNPQGGSAKVRARKANTVALKEIGGDKIFMRVCLDRINGTNKELKDFMADESQPIGAKVLLKGAVEDPKFMLTLWRQAVLTCSGNTPSVDIDSKDFMARVESRKRYFVRIMKDAGIYKSSLSIQVTFAARWDVVSSIYAEAAAKEGLTRTEISREGNERLSMSPLIKASMDAGERTQAALRALGLNLDTRGVVQSSDGDRLGEMLAEFKDDD